MVDYKLAGIDPVLLAVAWLTALALGSIAPQIVLRAGLKSRVSDRTSLFFQIGGLVAILALTWTWPTIWPLRRIRMVAPCHSGRLPAFIRRPRESGLALTDPGHVGRCCLHRRRDAQDDSDGRTRGQPGRLWPWPARRFIVPGDIHAISQPTLVTGLEPWTWLGPILAVVIALPLAVYVGLTRGSDLARLRMAAGLAPLILLGAGVNALNEEFIFRAVLLARLNPALGPAQSLWLTSVRFGVGHWFGNPRGPIGVASATLAGWFWGKSILETRGLFWAWVIHAIQDVVIYSLIAMQASG